MRLLVGEERVAHIGEVRFRFLGHHGLFFFELYEPHMVQFMRSFLRPGDCAIDLGANAGYLSAVALDCVGKTGRLIAVEAAPAHHAELRWLERLNPEHSVMALHCAAGDHDGEISLFLSAHRGWHSTVRGFNTAVSPQTEEVRVPLCMLDTLVEREGLMRAGAIRLIKIDVEGAEQAVIAGATKVLEARAAQALIIELTPPGPKHPVPEPGILFDRLARAGYSAFELRSYLAAPRKLSPADIKVQTDVLFLAT